MLPLLLSRKQLDRSSGQQDFSDHLVLPMRPSIAQTLTNVKQYIVYYERFILPWFTANTIPA
jgi:hypothetical protein